ncbi:hypothetical protein [Methanobrevibacter sp.]|uniref:hypothetical protein n=1 Tax=Methanobrevibacter sp. TaxID=66852 RepID=UPI00386E40DC
MDNKIDFEGIEIDQDLLERTNPIFNTARMTLLQLAATGHDDAKAVAKKLNLNQKDTQDSKTVKADETELFIKLVKEYSDLFCLNRILRQAIFKTNIS